MTTTRWAILGPGKIAGSFARDLALVEDAELVAVGSRSLERAEAFAAEHGTRDTPGATAAYGSYAELVADDRVDAVYVASPHSEHVEHVRLALDAGRPVLCEKPLTLRARDAEELFTEATGRGLLLMEAMWTACHPVILRLRDLIARGELGSPRHLHAELGFVLDDPPRDRLVDPALGAGALLDMGIYPLILAHLLLGEAEELRAVAMLADSGIDHDVAVVGRHPGGALSTMSASITSWSSRRAELATDRGRLVLEDFHHPTEATFTPADGGDAWSVEGAEPVVGRGYAHEVVEFQRCLRAGRLESDLVPHAQTLTILRQLDDVRAQVGVRYAGD